MKIHWSRNPPRIGHLLQNFVSYRSPWSNSYDPPLEDGSMPSEKLRKLEIDANHAFDQYREMYFDGGVSSVYLWDLDHGFAGNQMSCTCQRCFQLYIIIRLLVMISRCYLN